MDVVFVTGLTGLLGRNFIRELCKKGNVQKVYALVRNPEAAHDIIAKGLPEYASYIELLEGDISKPSFGLLKKDLEKLKEVTTFYHLAACVHLGHSPRVKEKLKNMNINGTKHALSLFKYLKSMKHFIFVSTAYSAGYYGKKIPENWLEKPHFFRNHYEESKWKCEEMIKKKLKGSKIQYSIVRPSILLDSIDNPAISKHTIYLFSNFMFHYGALVPGELELVGDKNATINFMFAPDLVKFLLLVSDTKSSKVYNFANPVHVSIGELKDTISKGLSLKQNIVFKEEIDIAKGDNSIKGKLLRKMASFIPYTLNGSMDWSIKNTEALLKKGKMTLQKKKNILLNLEDYCRHLKKNMSFKLWMYSKINRLKKIFA